MPARQINAFKSNNVLKTAPDHVIVTASNNTTEDRGDAYGVLLG